MEKHSGPAFALWYYWAAVTACLNQKQGTTEACEISPEETEFTRRCTITTVHQMRNLPPLYSYKKVEKMLKLITFFIPSVTFQNCFKPASANTSPSPGGLPQCFTVVNCWKSTSLSNNALEKQLPISNGAFANTFLGSVKSKLFPMGFGTYPSIHSWSRHQCLDAWLAGWVLPPLTSSEGSSSCQLPEFIGLSGHCTSCNSSATMWTKKARPTKACFTCQSVPGSTLQFYQLLWSSIYTADPPQAL